MSGAERGTLAVMVSAPRADFELLTPLYEIIARPFYLGDKPGSGQTIELVNNLLAATGLIATCEAVALGVKAGLEATVMIDVRNAGSAAPMPAVTSSRVRSFRVPSTTASPPV